jgi:AraC family transcriptional regulator, regulatory protein of adaptative response / methylated-DNA-[protein]-cysteine methyltransferase
MLPHNEILCTQIETPIGKMIAGATLKGICLLEFDEPGRLEKHKKHFLKNRNSEFIQGESPFFGELEKQISAYFEKKLVEFTIPLDLIGSNFQLQVWNELLKIPFGQTRTYKQQSIAVGNIKSIRAVASANGDNAVSIIVPCHRVIGTDGSLTGYGGKIWRKKFLLELESKQMELF